MKAIQMTEELHDYMVRHGQALSPVLPRLAQETRTLPNGGMQIAPDQGQLMYLLTKLTAAKRVLEVGCFTGYSALCMAAALPADGKLITLDVNPEATSVARRYWTDAGVAAKIELRLAPALETLPKLESEYGAGGFDLMFIDADKQNMSRYYEWGLKLVRQGGLILADNVLWSGSVIDKASQREDVEAIRAFNDHVAADDRVEKVMLSISDGLYMCRKR